MAVDLDWFLQQQTFPTPDPAPFVQPSAALAATPVGDVAQGCGILVPFQRDGKGDFANACGLKVIQASISQILGVVARTDTAHGELEWRPEFGSQLDRLRHLPADEGTAELGRYHVIDALRIWEPRVNVLDAALVYRENTQPGADGGTILEINVLYDVITSRRGAALIAGVQQTVNLFTAAA